MECNLNLVESDAFSDPPFRLAPRWVCLTDGGAVCVWGGQGVLYVYTCICVCY